ncbi:MAG: SpoIID/LytB domain-containing protein [Chloroflexi bacterium]|nr:MAG: SpoIID/LytB domain-containing protein [Chloroflexota bacterium]TME48518.1 MAG: SpoIID/LytB domain-containing protein [Chloroflexota bacterium]
MPDTSKVRRRAHAIVIAAIILIAAVPMGSAEAASPTATLVSGTVLPRDPPMDGIVRLDLLVRNDTSNAWSAGDPVHLSWKSGGKTMAEDVRPLGQPVPANGTVRVNLVTLAPAATGDFSLAVELETHGNRLPIGDPTAFHLNGFLFRGKGNGHGLGMSQWGARGRASSGQDYRKILGAYYTGTRIDRRDTSMPVRIALTDDPIDLARPWPRLFGPLPFVAGPVSVDGVPQLQVAAGTSIGFDVDPASGPIAFVLNPDGSRGAPVAIKQTLTVRSSNPAGIRTNIMQVMGGDFRPGAEQRRYAGILEIIPKGGTTILPVNVLPMEEYLKGVVPAEMPPYWGVEALKAQAIAGRTYGIAHLGGGADFDLRASESDQAYSGLTDQRADSNNAVDATRGQVLTYQAKLITAFYMASDGGHTESSEYRFVTWDHGPQLRSHLGYLTGISDPLDRGPSWQVGPFSAAGAAIILQDDGRDLGNRLLGIDVLQKDASGRLVGVRLRGSSKTIEVSGPTLRALFGLPDTLVEIIGGG